jgi:hypothetical protein
MYENVTLYLTCVFPTTKDTNVLCIRDNEIGKENLFLNRTLYVSDSIRDFIESIKNIQDSANYSLDNIKIVDYSSTILFHTKLFYISRIFKTKKVLLYSIHLTPSLLSTLDG